MFHQVLVWEAEDADLLSEHFLTVACYNLQHPAMFQDSAIENLKGGLVLRIDQNAQVPELRRRAAAAYNGPQRVLKPVPERKSVLQEWHMTIAEVYANGEPLGAADRVRAWGKSTREDLRP
ncbi:hypothetical protein DC3_17300 [Deinococcus cellulosilyticus NBRC 106333 = KACC 11606]|uniref:Uncharacterized protein n=2 Tax=Deinococcus cellulosilyticus TaxID=401558 RepID=A0A511MZP7_DEIC1|nr:hypothetical protein DC3_17300 [Deinococcus cellulosilyticus NBRC 106333 = KACC 11606]